MFSPRWHLSLALAAALSLGACGSAVPATAAQALAVGPSASAKLPSPGAKATGTITGDVRLIAGVTSHFLQQPRDVWVYLPPGYDRSTSRYPVLYMHDGNNIFDGTHAFGGHEWQADETAERLIRAGQLPPMMIVGVGNTSDRMNEYTWLKGTANGQATGGEGQQYADFLVKELKPLIDRTYRTQPDRDHTGVLGSSLGGLESFYLGRYDADTYSKIGVMSPSIWWDNKAVLQEVPKLTTNLKIWLDIGWREGNTPQEELDNARAMDQALVARGYTQGANLSYFEDQQGGHDEQAWAYRLPMALSFLFGTGTDNAKTSSRRAHS